MTKRRITVTVDAHLVALCLGPGAGVVATSDPDDIRRLAAPFPALRVVTYRIDGPA